jgi:hypothetical protein
VLRRARSGVQAPAFVRQAVTMNLGVCVAPCGRSRTPASVATILLPKLHWSETHTGLNFTKVRSGVTSSK